MKKILVGLLVVGSISSSFAQTAESGNGPANNTALIENCEFVAKQFSVGSNGGIWNEKIVGAASIEDAETCITRVDNYLRSKLGKIDPFVVENFYHQNIKLTKKVYKYKAKIKYIEKDGEVKKYKLVIK